jgi:FeS assembly SUF system protein
MGIFDMFSKDKKVAESDRMSIGGLSKLDAGPARPAAPVPPLPPGMFAPSDGPPRIPASEPATGAPGAAGGAPETDALEATGTVEERVVGVLKTCFDPEIPVNIYELGLIYEIKVDAASAVEVKMTLTSPMCPVAGSLPPEVEGKIKKVQGVTAVKVELVWDPPWTPALMSEAAKLQLNMF